MSKCDKCLKEIKVKHKTGLCINCRKEELPQIAPKRRKEPPKKKSIVPKCTRNNCGLYSKPNTPWCNNHQYVYVNDNKHLDNSYLNSLRGLENQKEVEDGDLSGREKGSSN